jgi:hypothetical protein
MQFAKLILVNFIFTIIGLLVVLKLLDLYLGHHRHTLTPDEDADTPTMRTMEFYPFTGGQIQAYKKEQGRLPWRIPRTTSRSNLESTVSSLIFVSKLPRLRSKMKYGSC